MGIAAEFATRGRLTRSGFWLRQLTVVPVAYGVVIAVSDTALAVPAALLATVLLVSIWGRRLHDRGRPAWWLLLAAVPVLGPLLLCIECGLRRSVEPGSPVEDDGAVKPDHLTVGAPHA